MNAPRKNIEKIITEENRNLVYRFFLSFARFEYALKCAGYLKNKQNGERADPSRLDFSKNNYCKFNPSITPELKASCDYFIQNPPKVQIVDPPGLGWIDFKKQGKLSLLEWLLDAVAQVRNNLFHGGKFPLNSVPEPARDTTLLRHSLTILDACVPLDYQVELFYFDFSE